MNRRILGCALAASVCACGGSKQQNNLKGVFAGQGESGVFTATRVEHEFTTSGAFKTSAGAVPLFGQIDPVSGTTTLNGGGYSLVGALKNDVLTGHYTGPKGNGQFAAQLEGSVAALFCGTFSGSDSGVLNVVQGNTGKLQVAYVGAQIAGVANGTPSGGNYSASDGTNNFTGTISGGTTTGSYSAGSLNGTFSATSASCPQ